MKRDIPKVGDVLKNDWEQILLEQAKVVFKYLIKIGVSKEDAEDITQETIIKTIEYIGQIYPSKLKAWMFKVAIHRYYSLYNKNKTTINLNDEDLHFFLPALEHVESSLLEKELTKELANALKNLQSTFQQLLILKYYMDLSYKEISDILDVKESHVKTYLQRARNTLKKVWEEKGYGK